MKDRPGDRSTADDWWSFFALSGGRRDERVELERGESGRARAAWQAREVVDEIVAHGGEPAIRLIQDLIAAAPDSASDGVPSAVGAGPLEDLIVDHGDELIDVIEQTARQSPGFAAALGHFSLAEGALRPDTAARLARWRKEP